MNSVMSFLRNNGIMGPLRDDILDYFEFRCDFSALPYVNDIWKMV